MTIFLRFVVLGLFMITSVTADPLSALKELKIPSGTITLVERDDAPTLAIPGKPSATNLPPRTIVKMVLNPAKGSNINVEIWLPDADKWNGRMVGLGNGGAAGHIGESAFVGPLSGGYATGTTDMGTAPNPDIGDGNPEVWKDFGFRATHLMTLATKQVTEAFYGKAPEFSYFVGSSTGGQQSLQEAQRYPDDYEGIVAGIPAHCRTPLHAYFLWNYQILTKCPFTKSQEVSVIAAANEYMAPREAPGVAGRFISDSRGERKDFEAVIALARKKDPTLTDAQADALRKLFDGPKSESGARIFNGMPLGTFFDATTGNLYLFKWVFGAKKDFLEINFGADMDTYTSTLGPYLNAENPDLTAFNNRGGKLIMTAGSADPLVPAHSSIDYYEKVITRFGGLDKVHSFFRFYIIPGMAHGGGPGISQLPNLLESVRAWREKGTVPDGLTGRQAVDGKTVLTMPLYPYPTKAEWDAASSSFKPVDGPRIGVERVADQFLPPAAE